MFFRNSFRSRKGNISSSGLLTKDPSGLMIENGFGIRGWSGGMIISQKTGPVVFRTCRILFFRFSWSEILKLLIL